LHRHKCEYLYEEEVKSLKIEHLTELNAQLNKISTLEEELKSKSIAETENKNLVTERH
jgi:hypothetical protein